MRNGCIWLMVSFSSAKKNTRLWKGNNKFISILKIQKNRTLNDEKCNEFDIEFNSVVRKYIVKETTHR